MEVPEIFNEPGEAGGEDEGGGETGGEEPSVEIDESKGIFNIINF